MKVLYVNAKRTPFYIVEFVDLVKILSLENPLNIERFFDHLQSEVNKGRYVAGFICYEVGYLLEERFQKFIDLKGKFEIPLACFGVYKKVIKRREFNEEVESFSKVFLEDLRFNVSEREYVDSVFKIKNYIESGDVYQVNYTFKTKFKLKGLPIDLFKNLLFSQRCEYGFYIEMEDIYILSLSPELFLKKNKENILSSPMKGTAKRGKNLYEDIKLKKFLKTDPKTQAENLMIVDLIRNDLGKICERGSVMVKELFKIKTYPTLHQVISTIKGTLKKEMNLFDIFKALFPCGSVTGAPKIRAMEIIYELEKEPRKIYTGTIGYVTPKGDFLFNVSIRTLLLKRINENIEGEAGIGSGIVWDSEPKKEHEECLLKARFFANPLQYFQLIETFLWCPFEENPLLKLHYARLKKSAIYFKFKIPEVLKSFDNFKKFINSEFFKKRLDLEKKYKARLLLFPSGEVRLEFLFYEPWKEGLKIIFIKRDFDLGIFHFYKTTVRGPLEENLAKAVKMGFDEVVFFDEKERLLEGSMSSIFLRIDGKLYTPPFKLGIVDGVLRKFLILKKEVIPKVVTLEDLKRAEEIYIGNAVRGLGKVTDWVILK